MSVLDQLASAQGHRDEGPNEDLARQLAASEDATGIAELVTAIGAMTDQPLRSDAIKVLYEVGAIRPELIVPHTATFVGYLSDRQNRLVWGAMTALDTIARAFPERVFPHLASIMAATDCGSVITKDHGLGVLIGLCQVEGFRQATFPLLLEQLRSCPAKQVPLYAERCLVLIPVINTLELARTLLDRFDELEKESQRKRLKKVLVKLGAPNPAG